MRWDPNRVESQKLAVHAALLHTGKIVYFSGDEHDPGRHYLGKTDPTYIDSTRVYDCATGAVATVDSPEVPAGALSPDLFCCGHAFLPDGRLLVAGGTESWTAGHPGDPDPAGHHAGHGHFTGLRYAWIFDPDAAAGTNPWSRAADMLPQRGSAVGGGRWYPTLVTLASGQCLAMSGHPATTHQLEHTNLMVEVFDRTPTPTGAWHDRGDVPAGGMENYPRLHLLPNGEVLSATPIAGRCRAVRPGSGPASTWRDVAPAPPDALTHDFSVTTVLLPLLPQHGYAARVLLCGGPVPVVLDPLAAAPAWTPTSGPRAPIRGSNARRRVHVNAVILPTMEVMVLGGFEAGVAVPEVEVYDPPTDSWRTLPPEGTAAVPRNYHSVALLMPDGRVWTAGGNDRGDWSYHNSADYPAGTPLPLDADDPGIDNRETQIEVFEPDYYGRPDRPTIASAPALVRYGQQFTIQTPDAATIGRVALIRAGSVTHAFNGDQRYVGLAFTRGDGELRATAPPDGNVAPPGTYLLFVVSTVTGQPVPSVGAFVRVSAAGVKRPKELKPEIKELKNELHEVKIRKVELREIEVKRSPEFIDPKLIRENFEFEDPRERVLEQPPELLRVLAERVDELEERLAEGSAFIRPEERPEVGEKTLAEDPEKLLAAREAAEAAAREEIAELRKAKRPPHEHDHEG